MSDHDSSFFKTFVGVLGFLVVLAFVIFFVAQYVIDKSGINDNAETQSIRDEAIAKRIAPEGKVRMMGDAEIASASAGAASAGPKSAKDIVAATCAGCHGSGVLGAPKIGDKASWDARYAGGLDALVASAIAGKGAMPPRGGNASLSDEEVRAAIEQMLADSGLDVSVSDLTAGAAASEAAPTATSDAAPVAEAETAANPVAAATEAVTHAASAMADSAAAVAGSVADAAGNAATAVSEAVAPAADSARGKEVYGMACVACHAVGVAGAPRLGDKASWSARIAQGIDTLHTHALKGFRGMPPKGGRMDLSDSDVAAAVDYMVSQAQ
ncbi:MAG: cytochrome c5 family protein [Gammaproteobacteria bacterium]|nr:cytochrome c5 family protein [Gammaproteobacteria bacterium]MCP5138163.1 cytochrome c5 family protein [Gammaproteobacteria bacterium]